MKIPSASGKFFDTDSLNDKDAAIFEALNTFYEVCEKYNVTAFGKVILNEKKGIGNSCTILHLPNENDEIRGKEYTKLVSSIAEWVYKTSDGRLQIFDTQDDDSTPDSENDNSSQEEDEI